MRLIDTFDQVINNSPAMLIESDADGFRVMSKYEADVFAGAFITHP
jgi:hypothetical protein